MKLSKEEDLKTLKNLGYHIYDDIELAKNKLFKSISPSSNKKNSFEMLMYSAVHTYVKEFTDLKKIIGKCDYMKRSTNTNDKCIIVIAFLYADYMTHFGDYTGVKNKINEMLYYYTEEKIYPQYKRILTSKDINDLIREVTKDSFENSYYKALQNCIASMIYYYNF